MVEAFWVEGLKGYACACFAVEESVMEGRGASKAVEGPLEGALMHVHKV